MDENLAPIAAEPKPCLLDAVRQGSGGIAIAGQMLIEKYLPGSSFI